MNQSDFPGDQTSWIELSQTILNSYARWLGQELLPRTGDAEQQAEALWQAPFVVVAHNTLADPVLIYGNRTALNLWEMDLSTFLATPSRHTAEPMHRDERARLLAKTAEQGYVDDYSGIRISQSGKRFRIHQAIVWNLIDSQDNPVGQAATFDHWTPIVNQ